MMGDFNCVMNEVLDKSVQTSSYSSMPKVWENWINEREVWDIWRDNHKGQGDYSYSGRHDMFSRVDYIFQKLNLRI